MFMRAKVSCVMSLGVSHFHSIRLIKLYSLNLYKIYKTSYKEVQPRRRTLNAHRPEKVIRFMTVGTLSKQMADCKWAPHGCGFFR